MAKPRKGVFVSALGQDVVLLDVETDSYLALVDAVEPAFGDRCGDLLRLNAVSETALLEAGLFEHGAPPRLPPTRLPRPVEAFVDLPLAPVGPRDLLDLFVAVLGAMTRLRSRRPCATYLAVEDTAGHGSADAALSAALAKLRTLRLALPLPTRCLPASLMTCIFLGRKGIETDIVFAVRSHPFEAHCWVEHRGAVIDDEVDRLRAFSRIATGRL